MFLAPRCHRTTTIKNLEPVGKGGCEMAFNIHKYIPWQTYPCLVHSLPYTQKNWKKSKNTPRQKTKTLPIIIEAKVKILTRAQTRLIPCFSWVSTSTRAHSS